MPIRPHWICLAALVACDDGGGESTSADATTAPDAAVPADAQVVDLPDGEVRPVVGNISGDLTYAAVDDAGGHLYSVRGDGSDVQRITTEAGFWGAHAVAPDRRRVAVVRHQMADRSDRGVVWVLDLRAADAYAITPDDCDAGAGGVGWRDDRRLIFSMSCADGAEGVWMSAFDNTGRDRDLMLPLTDLDVQARDVTAAVGTPLFAYSRLEEICEGDACEMRSTLWVGNESVGSVCRVTDGDPQRRDVWAGDREPAFTANLGALVFARHVPEKDGPLSPHYDVFRMDVDQRAIFDGGDFCGLPGTLTTLTDALISDMSSGVEGLLSERQPQPLTEIADGTVTYLFLGQSGPADDVRSGAFLVDLSGMAGPLLPSANMSHVRWIVTEYDTSGER
ncbi:MAG: TolB family protein [Bradymonadia bacterium]